MKAKLIPAILLVIVVMISVSAHDLFLKLDSYFVRPNEKVSIKILNGSFQGSDGAVSFARLADVSVISPSQDRENVKETDFTKDDKTSYIGMQPMEPGNYVVGLSTMTREIDLAAKDFNEYLVEDGIPDTLDERKAKNEMDRSVRERYSKHVKTVFQVGDRKTGNYKAVFGYPVEIVPQNNPYSLKVGDSFEFLCLKAGKPIAHQFVMTGYDDGTNLRIGENVRSDKKGVAKLKISVAGKWYVKFINMSRLDDPKINYESKWASLSFEAR
jgi:uncharacterized GH25 family protein